MYDIQRPFLRKHFRPAVKRNKNEKNSRAPVHTQSMAECEQTNSKWSMKWKKISGWCREWYCGIYVSWGRLNAFGVKNDDNEEEEEVGGGWKLNVKETHSIAIILRMDAISS